MFLTALAAMAAKEGPAPFGQAQMLEATGEAEPPLLFAPIFGAPVPRTRPGKRWVLILVNGIDEASKRQGLLRKLGRDLPSSPSCPAAAHTHPRHSHR